MDLGDYTVGGHEDTLFRADMARIGPKLWRMQRDTVGCSGEMHIRFKDGRIVEETRHGFTLTVNTD